MCYPNVTCVLPMCYMYTCYMCFIVLSMCYMCVTCICPVSSRKCSHSHLVHLLQNSGTSPAIEILRCDPQHCKSGKRIVKKTTCSTLIVFVQLLPFVLLIKIWCMDKSLPGQIPSHHFSTPDITPLVFSPPQTYPLV